MRWEATGQEVEAELYVDAYGPMEGVEVLARYVEDAEGGWPVGGLAAVTSRRVGRGRVITLGTTLPRAVLGNFLSGVCREAGVGPVVEATHVNGAETVLAVERGGGGGGEVGGDAAATVLVEWGGQDSMVLLKRGGVDVLTGERVDREVPIESYATRVIRHEG